MANLEDQITKAVERLNSGDVVAIPTETVYGLAASIENEAGLKKVFSLKQRPFFDPLIVHVSSREQARSLVTEWSDLAEFLADRFWPGPLTLVLPKAAHVSSLITSGLETVAVRHPRHAIAEKLIRSLGSPIAAPSANRFGRTSPSKPEHVRSEFPNEDLLILDGGACEVGLESTVVSVTQSEIKILRPGGVTEADLNDALKAWKSSVKVSRAIGSENSPGHLKHHYMPDIPLVIFGAKQTLENTEAKLAEALSFQPKRAKEMVLNTDAAIAARELYNQLRQIASSDADMIFVRRLPSQTSGYWEAIWDRLNRAATLDLSAH